MIKTFYSFSFGCRINEIEKQEIDRKMTKAGFGYAEANPDIYIINTCAVTQKAEREARQLIYRTKKKFPNTKIVITGCSATYWKKNNTYVNLPVDLVIENINKEYLINTIIKKYSSCNKCNKIASSADTRCLSYNDIRDCSNNLLFDRGGRTGVTNKYINSGRYLVKIQDGCQRFCSYCIVPYLRGKPKSERIKNLVRQLADRNLENQVKEVILTAINTEAYGIDTNESLTDLLNTLIDKTKIPRISMGSIHPWSINKAFLEFYQVYKDKKRLVDFFHIPIQSGSDIILKLMKRNYTNIEMMEKLESLKRINPMAFIATDVIVGFLGETDQNFEDTYIFLEKSLISKFHVFRFSNRPNTAAWYMKDSLENPKSDIKAKRSKLLLELSNKKYNQFLEKHINNTFSALVLEKQLNGYHEALLSNQIPVFIKTPQKDVRNILNVKVVKHKNNKLFGKII